ncbi:hypothetical protein ER57_04625 [Smithella sp. SCADC]|jgi:hypothetical protein|nr:hypothetical protein ER57_04625 [Smithella sp. SCADC]HAR49273.1 hypothetical protein [Smithella sp.]
MGKKKSTKLYRYRSMNSENLSRIFTHCELYFAKPKEFNDPFDCQPPFSINNYSENDLREHFENAYKSECPEICDAKRKAIIEKRIEAISNNKYLFKLEIIDPFIKRY